MEPQNPKYPIVPAKILKTLYTPIIRAPNIHHAKNGVFYIPNPHLGPQYIPLQSKYSTTANTWLSDEEKKRAKTRIIDEEKKRAKSDRNKEKYLRNKHIVLERVREYRKKNRLIICKKKREKYAKNKHIICKRARERYAEKTTTKKISVGPSQKTDVVA